MLRVNLLDGILLLACLLVLPGCASPVAPGSAPEPTPTLAPPREIRVEAGEVTLHVRKAGNPEAEDVLLAINMGPGFSSHTMVSLERLAGESLAVVTYDQRGTGRSTQPSTGYGLLDYVADLEAVREAVGAEQVHLFGHCWGGLIATRYATIHPERVRSLALWGGAWPSSDIVATAQANLAHRRLALQEEGIIPTQLTAFEQVLPGFLSDPHFQLPAEFGQAEYNPRVEMETIAALGEYDLTAKVGELDLPVLFLWGEDDPFGLETAEATTATFSSADLEFVVIEACGHLWQECPSAFFDQLAAFFGQSSSPQG